MEHWRRCRADGNGRRSVGGGGDVIDTLNRLRVHRLPLVRRPDSASRPRAATANCRWPRPTTSRRPRPNAPCGETEGETEGADRAARRCRRRPASPPANCARSAPVAPTCWPLCSNRGTLPETLRLVTELATTCPRLGRLIPSDFATRPCWPCPGLKSCCLTDV